MLGLTNGLNKLIVGDVDEILMKMLGFWTMQGGVIIQLGLRKMTFREEKDMIML